jgi:hypothetical protein
MAADINALNQEIADLRKQLGEKPLTPFDPKDLDKALLTVRALRQEFREASSDLDYISKSFKDTVNEMSKQNTHYNTAKKSINGIADISKQLVDYRRGETSLNEKQLKNLQNQARVKFEELKLAINIGQLNQKDLEAAQAALDEKDAFNAALNRTLVLQEQVNKEVGLLGAGLEGAGKFLEKMGFAGIAKPISDAIQKTKDARFQIKLNQDAIAENIKEYEDLSKLLRPLTKQEVDRKRELLKQKETLEDQNKELDKQTNKYKNIANSLKEQFTFANAVDFVFTNIASSFLKLNEAQTEFTRETGRNIPHLDTINSSLISSVDYIKTATSLTQQFGFAADAVFSKDTIEAASKLQVLMGMSAEEAGNAAVLSKMNGSELKDQSQSVLDQVGAYNLTNKSALNNKTILKDVYATSQTIQLSLGGSTKKITDANIAARALGLSLKEVEGISDSLLDIESSIASEFEAEVITGKQLNLEAARYYALQNDLEGVAKEIGNNQEVLNTFAKGNRIEQEAIAKAMGLSKDQISKMIYAKELDNNVTKEQAALNAGMKLEDLERLTVQESITKSMEKMGSALAGPLETLASMLDNMSQFSGIITTVIGSMIVLKTITSTILGIEKSIAAYKAISTARTAAMASLEAAVTTAKTAQNATDLRGLALGKSKLVQLAAQAALWALSNPIMALVGLATAAVVGVAAYSYFSKAGDVNSPADGKTQISTKEGGLFELSKNDDLVAFPGASKALNSKNAPVIVNQTAPQQQSQAIDYDKMAQAMSRVKVQTNLDGVRVSSELQKAPLGIATRKI